MDASIENQLNIKLSGNPQFKLIIDECTPRNNIPEIVLIKEDLCCKLEIISEDRERLKKQCQDLQKERIGLIQDISNRQGVHEELQIYFAKVQNRTIRELEMEAKVLAEVLQRKSALLSRMRGLLQHSPVKENQPIGKLRKKSVEIETVLNRKLFVRESLSPTIRIGTARRQKVAAFRNSVCN